MKTDLTKILSVPGQPGLFRYIAQARNGAVVESLADGKRSSFGASSRISALSDISIYSEDGEVKLQDVFLKMKAELNFLLKERRERLEKKRDVLLTRLK